MAEVFIDPEKYNIYAGDAWSQSFEFGELEDPDDESSAFTPDDLSAYGGWLAQWRVTADATEKIDLTVDATDAVNGVIAVSASEAQTRAMAESGEFDIQATTPAVRTFVRAKTKWRQDVTR